MYGVIVVGREYLGLVHKSQPVRSFKVLSYDPVMDDFRIEWEDGKRETLFRSDIEWLIDNYMSLKIL